MTNIINLEDYRMSVPAEEGERLRDWAKRLGHSLLWHAENTPLSTWATVAKDKFSPANANVSRLLHALYRHRPKRQPTPEELQAIKESLRGHVLSAELFESLITDPDWVLFSASLIDDIDRTEGMKLI